MEYNQQTGPAAEIGTRDALAVVWRRKWVILVVLAASIGGAVLITHRTPKLYRASEQLIIMTESPRSSATPDAAMAAPLIESPATQINMLKSDQMPQRVMTWLQNDALSKGRRAEDDEWGLLGNKQIWKHYSDHVTVSNPEGTNLINIAVVLPDPTSAKYLADAIAYAFVDWKTETARSKIQQTADSLDKKVHGPHGTRQTLEAAERAEMAFKSQHHLADVNVEQKAALDQYLTRDAEVAAAQADVSAQEARVNDLKQRLSQTTASIKKFGGRDDGEVVRLQGVLADRQQKLDSALRIYTPEHPSIPVLQGEVKDIEEQLRKARARTVDTVGNSPSMQSSTYAELREAQTQLVSAREKLHHTMATRNQLQAKTARIPAEALEYARLLRASEAARGAHQQYQAALETARLNQETAVGNIKDIAAAVAPEAPFQPDMTKNLMLGSLIGIALAMGLAILMEQSDRRVRSVKDVRRLVAGPVVGALPSLSRNQLHHMIRGELPPVAMETYGMARANLAMALRKSGQADPWHRQIILVTSAIPGEGKSLTAAQLSRSLARSGKTVVLVDADMRRPSQNRLFNTAEPVGLADVLTGNLPLQEALVTSDTENLSILHSGMPVRNPTELISLPQMVATMEALRNEADVVIIDAPACAAMADALLIAPHVDCIFHVIGMGMVDEQTMAHTLGALNAAAPKTMVFFVNRTPKSSGRNAYRSYYSYQYSYADAGANGKAPLPLPAAAEGKGDVASTSSGHREG